MVGGDAPCSKFIRLAQDAGLVAFPLKVSSVGKIPFASGFGPEECRPITTRVLAASALEKLGTFA
ncbi:hypothetical protein ACTRXD_16700 [Nitrospira sp. T9]